MQLPRAVLPQWDRPARERPLVGPVFVAFWGVAFPALAGLYGLACILRQEAMVVGGQDVVMLHGINAQVAGLALLAAAAIFHVQCFWNVIYDSNPLAARVKLVFMGVLGFSAYFLCYHMLTNMR